MKQIRPSTFMFSLVLFALTLTLFAQPTNPVPGPTTEPVFWGFTKTDLTAFIGALSVLAMYIGRIIAAIKGGTSISKSLFSGSTSDVKAVQEQIKEVPKAIQSSDTRFLQKAIDEKQTTPKP